jgi:hypothetical protein
MEMGQKRNECMEHVEAKIHGTTITSSGRHRQEVPSRIRCIRLRHRGCSVHVVGTPQKLYPHKEPITLKRCLTTGLYHIPSNPLGLGTSHSVHQGLNKES